MIKSEPSSAWLRMSHAVLLRLKSTTNSRACDPALHIALYNCQFLWAKSGPVNSLGWICSGTSPAVSSRAHFQNPQPVSGYRAGNPFTVMSLSNQIKALSCLKSIHTENKYIMFQWKKRDRKEETERKLSRTPCLCEHSFSFHFLNCIS